MAGEAVIKKLFVDCIINAEKRGELTYEMLQIGVSGLMYFDTQIAEIYFEGGLDWLNRMHSLWKKSAETLDSLVNGISSESPDISALFRKYEGLPDEVRESLIALRKEAAKDIFKGLNIPFSEKPVFGKIRAEACALQAKCEQMVLTYSPKQVLLAENLESTMRILAVYGNDVIRDCINGGYINNLTKPAKALLYLLERVEAEEEKKAVAAQLIDYAAKLKGELPRFGNESYVRDLIGGIEKSGIKLFKA